MKRELAEEDKHLQNQDHPMFSKFHHLSSSAAATGDYQEADSHTPANAADGATIEVVRRPRGRPPGSKNKPKPPVIITRDAAEPAMSPYVLELPGGVDIVDSTARFCRKRNVGLCLLSGSGAVTNVTLKQPSSTPGATVTFHGRFDILSISATVLPPAAANSPSSPFSLSLAGPQGQVVGGHVVGPLISAGTIYLVAANFTNPSFHRLQAAEQEEEDNSGGHESPKTISGGGSGGAPPQPPTTTYSYQANDVVWAPANRLQPPPY